MTSSVLGQRRSPKHFPKPNLHQGKAMVTVWWSTVRLIHYSFLNPTETMTSEKHAQKIDLLFSHSVMFDSLRLHGLQHARFPYPSPSPGPCSNSYPSSVKPSNHLILCCPLLLLPSIFPDIRVFSNELVLCIRWPKYWSFCISPSRK